MAWPWARASPHVLVKGRSTPVSSPGCEGRGGERVKLLLLLLLGAGPHLGEMPGPGHHPVPHRKAKTQQSKHRPWALSLLRAQTLVFIS